MKKYFVLAMMAFAAIITTLGFTACSSDDDDNNTPETQKVTEVKVKMVFDYLHRPFDLSKAFNLYAYTGKDGKAFYYANEGYVSIYAKDDAVYKVKDKDGKDVTMKCYRYTEPEEITVTKFPATLTYTVYAQLWVDVDKDLEEGDVYDFFVSPFFAVHTNLDKTDDYTRVVPADNPGYTYVPQYNFMDIKNDHSKRSDLEGKYIVTLNIDKDGNCTATYKKEKLDDAEQK